MNVPETGVEAIARAVYLYVFGAGLGGFGLWGLWLAFSKCNGWRKELLTARRARQQAEIERQVAPEREISSTLRRADDAQDVLIRILEKQLEQQNVELKGCKITIARQQQELLDCWKGHPNTRVFVDVLERIELMSQRQDQIEARGQVE